MKNANSIVIIFFLSAIILSDNIAFASNPKDKPRIIVTADPELDDNNSLIRFLLYSSEFNIEGLVYASSQFHWKGDGKGTKFMVPGREYTRYGLNLCPCESYRWKKDERFIHDAVEAYEKVFDNLKIHNPSYPSPRYLKSKIKYGNIEFEGEFTKDTEGSNLIKAAMLDDMPGPLYITAWGGQSTIARALKSIEEEFSQTDKWVALKQKISKKVVLLPSGDQDNTYESYIKPNWPNIDYRQYRNGPSYGYGAQLTAKEENAKYLTTEWMNDYIVSKGALGTIYRVWGDGKQQVKGDIFDYFGMTGYTNEELKKLGYIVWMPIQKKGSWLGEGDTGTFMNIISNGLNADEKNTPGGWGGRPFVPDPKTYVNPFSNDTSKVKDLVISASTLQRLSSSDELAAEFPSFFPAAQNDFAARMDWSVKSDLRAANHAPIITLKMEQEIQAKPGDILSLNAKVKDSDGDAFTAKWWQFNKYKNAPVLVFSNSQSLKTTIEIPKDSQTNQTLYLVLEVVDNGRINMTSYQTVKIIL